MQRGGCKSKHLPLIGGRRPRIASLLNPSFADILLQDNFISKQQHLMLVLRIVLTILMIRSIHTFTLFHDVSQRLKTTLASNVLPTSSEMLSVAVSAADSAGILIRDSFGAISVKVRVSSDAWIGGYRSESSILRSEEKHRITLPRTSLSGYETQRL